MGRPAKFCRDEAVVTAMHAFWDKGYEAVSVNELSQAMSITRSSFYNCFGSRDALFEEAIALYIRSAPDYFLLTLAPEAEVVPAFRQALKTLCRDRAADPDARGCMIINCLACANGSNKAAPKLVAMMEEKLDRFSALMETAIRRGEISRSHDPRATAQAILTYMIGVNMICKIVPSEAKLWRATEQFLNGIGLGAH